MRQRGLVAGSSLLVSLKVVLWAGWRSGSSYRSREQGLVRFIGITGHGLSAAAMHRRALDVFPFDSVLCPYNYIIMQNPKYAQDFEALYAVCQERNVAMQTIKSTAWRLWGLQEEQTTSTWYHPLTGQADIDKAVHWVLGRESIFLNTANDIGLLPKNLDAATRLTGAPDDAAMQASVGQSELEPLFY